MENYDKIKKYTLFPYVTIVIAIVLIIIGVLCNYILQLDNYLYGLLFAYIAITPYIYFFYRYYFCY